jgi:hypothetical protein
MVDLAFGLAYTLVSFRLCGVGAGEQVVGAIYVAEAERLPGLPVRFGGQVPPLEVAGGVWRILTVGRNMRTGDRPAIFGVLAGRLRGVLGLPLSGLAAGRSAGRVFGAEMLGLGAGLTDLGFSGRSAGGLAWLLVARRGGPAGGLVDRQVG